MGERSPAATLALLLAYCSVLCTFNAAAAATTDRLMHEQYIAFYGSIDYSVDQFAGGGRVFELAIGRRLLAA